MLETYSQWIIVATRADAFSPVPLDRDWRARERRAGNVDGKGTRKRSFFATFFA